MTAPLSAQWSLRGMNTQGADLVLSRIAAWGANGTLVPISVVSTIAPVAGSLDSITQGGTGECVFAAEAVYQPGFEIAFSFSEPVQLWGFRFAGPDSATWVQGHAVATGADLKYLGAVHFPGSGVLSAAPTAAIDFAVAAETWAAVPGVPASANWFGSAIGAQGSALFAVVDGGGLWLSQNQGVTWREITDNGYRRWLDCAMSADGTVLIAVAYGADRVSVSRDSGSTWVTATGAGARDWYGCAASGNGAVLVAVANSEGVWLSKDKGITWALQSPTPGNLWRSCAVSANGQVLLAVASAANPWLSRDGGATWASVSALGAANWRGCAVSGDGRTLLVSPYGGGMLRLSKDGGDTWTEVTAAGNRLWMACDVSANGATLLCTTYSGGSLWLSQDGGATWVEQTSAGGADWYGAAVSDDGLALLGAGYGGALKYCRLSETIPVPARWYARVHGHRRSSNPDTLVPQGLGATSLRVSLAACDLEFGGRGSIHGTVSDHETKKPLRRRVRLHRSRDGLLVRETWSQSDGSYRFDGISERYEYDIEAWDHGKNFFSVVANNQIPEVAA